jgi:hypothetical protein
MYLLASSLSKSALQGNTFIKIIYQKGQENGARFDKKTP